ncbi:hypothetical protein QBC34DRAFT_485324 [Podospora aff. communis PSN243]|uniref:LYC1 C-terminal domain-containing protein n=1 Tax=Podospora aff. communis PSN243 TaxID=3040156 RepID=A0AAV9GLM6_9PEZI|nr:hypothetical protein QBC34DRAFT_485324 [Podospora aff. communis PSN243]
MSTDAAAVETITITKDNVVLAEATPQQRTLTWELNGASWAGPMSLDEYIGREQALSETTLSANGGTRYFILHHKSDPNLIVSACEVLTKQALVARPSSGRGTATAVDTVPSYGLASIFTPPRFRGQGLASHMLRLVQEEALDTSLGASFGTLYSDIGRSFYARLGWPSFPIPQLTQVKLLTDDDVPELCARDCAHLQAKLERLLGAAAAAPAGNGEKRHVAFLPDFKQMSWHFARASTVGGDSWVYWDHDLRENKLKILRAVKGQKDGALAMQGLLRAALKEAQEWGLPKVLVGGGKLALAFDEREDGSIPSLRWKGGESLGDVVWEENEYYAWC